MSSLFGTVRPMSLSLRSLSARRYRIEGDLPSLHDADFTRRLLERRFEPLSAHEERAFGWVTAENCLDARFERGSTGHGPCGVFSLRIDKRRVNSRLLRAMMDLELRGRRKDAEAALEGTPGARPGEIAKNETAKKPSARLSRDERSELRKALTEELLRNTSPTMEVHPVLLYPRERMVLFGALSKPANETFRALFCDTFDVTLSLLTPYHRGLELLEGKGGGEALSALRRSEFGGAGLTAAEVPAALRQRARGLVAAQAAQAREATEPEALESDSIVPTQGDRR